MPRRSSNRVLPRSAAALCVITCLAVSGCQTGAHDRAGSDTPADAHDTDELENAEPGVQVEFELEGEPVRVTGHPDEQRCFEEMKVFSAKDPAFDAGATIVYEPQGTSSVGVWASEGYSVRFVGRGEVSMRSNPDGSTSYVLAAAEGTASVLPREPGSTDRIADLDLTAGTPVTASASFELTCPAP